MSAGGGVRGAEEATVLTPENDQEVLPRYFHLSKSEAKEVTAELRPDPAPVLRTVITAVPPVAPPACVAPQGGFPENLARANAPVPDVALVEPDAPAKRASVVPLTADLSRLHVTVSRRLLDKLTAARDALSHSHAGASEETILELGLDLVLARYAKRRGLGAKPRGGTSRKAASRPGDAPPATKRSRHVPADVWRAVWKRDGGCCAWELEGGGICGSTHRLELDHVDGFALGAETTVDACRLLCKFHQDVAARRLYGSELMDRYTRPKGSSCREPVAAYGRVSSCPTACLGVG